MKQHIPRWQALERRVRLAIIGGTLAVIFAFVGAVMAYQRYHEVKADPHVANKLTAEEVSSAVADLYIVPNGEEPSIIRIKDSAAVAGQEFFRGSQDGDYLLVYNKSKLAIIYREQADKLVRVGPLNDQSAAAQETGPPN
jgi:hypothetical protein